MLVTSICFNSRISASSGERLAMPRVLGSSSHPSGETLYSYRIPAKEVIEHNQDLVKTLAGVPTMSIRIFSPHLYSLSAAHVMFLN